MDKVKYIYENLDQFVASKLSPDDDKKLDDELNQLKNEIDEKNNDFKQKMTQINEDANKLLLCKLN